MNTTLSGTVLTSIASLTLLYNAYQHKLLLGKLSVTGFALLSAGNVLLLHSSIFNKSE